jgi:hypothetical protein
VRTDHEDIEGERVIYRRVESSEEAKGKGFSIPWQLSQETTVSAQEMVVSIRHMR